jgi:flagella basal body P-ring formation protein FlgA
MNKTDIIGKKTKRTIMSNKPIYENYLQKSWMIEKNEEITIENSIGSIYIKVDGIALQNADFMDKIKVMNKSSGQIFTAYVKNKKKVTLKPKQN